MINHIHTASGKEYRLDGLPPSADMPCAAPPCIRDIAHHLANLCRYNGATWRHYSVAEHSLLVATILRLRGESPAVQLAGLLHDAHEAYLGDVSTPIKALINTTPDGTPGSWMRAERTHAYAVRAHFGVTTAFASRGAAIQQADHAALRIERAHLLERWRPGISAEWPGIDVGSDGRPIDLRHGLHDDIDTAIEVEQLLTTGDELWSTECACDTHQHWRREFAHAHTRLRAEIDASLPQPADPTPAKA